MILDSILLGIFGNSIFEIIKSMGSNLINDKDEDLTSRIYESLENATTDFFQKYNDTYKNPDDSFLARESNIKLIVQSVYYGKDINLLQEIDRRGFKNEPDVSKEHLQYFISILKINMNDDFLLGKIIEEKKHIRESKEANQNIKTILEKVTAKPIDYTMEEKIQWQLTDIATGKEIPFKEGKKYHQKYHNGVEQIFMLKGNLISVDYKNEHGRWSYHEIDIKSGNAINNKFPYPISEYTLEVDESEIINKNIISLSNGYYQEKITLKWNRSSIIIYDINNKIQQLEVSGGWCVNHDNKTISPHDK